MFSLQQLSCGYFPVKTLLRFQSSRSELPSNLKTLLSAPSSLAKLSCCLRWSRPQIYGERQLHRRQERCGLPVHIWFSGLLGQNSQVSAAFALLRSFCLHRRLAPALFFVSYVRFDPYGKTLYLFFYRMTPRSSFPRINCRMLSKKSWVSISLDSLQCRQMKRPRIRLRLG